MINVSKNSDLSNSTARITFHKGGELTTTVVKKQTTDFFGKTVLLHREVITAPNNGLPKSQLQILNWNKNQLQFNCSLGSVSQSKKFNFSFLNYCKELNIVPNKATPIQILNYNLSQICKDLKADNYTIELV